jgi:hypothetical protein
MKLRSLALLAAAALALTGSALARPGSAPPGGTAVGIEEDEFTIAVYRKVVPPGLVRFNIQNIGEDAHNLVVVGPNGRTIEASPEVRAGDLYTLRVRLRREGRYRLLCTQADHLERGMKSRIRVRRDA